MDPVVLRYLLSALVIALLGAAVLLVFAGCLLRQRAVHDLIVDARLLQNEQLNRRRRMLAAVSPTPGDVPHSVSGRTPEAHPARIAA